MSLTYSNTSAIIMIMMSLFSCPFVKSYQETEGSLNFDIYSKDKKCGYIILASDNLKFFLSCGLKSGKGLIPVQEAILEYEDKKLIIKSTKNINKNILSIDCDPKFFEKALDYLKILQQNNNASNKQSKKDAFFNNTNNDNK